MWFCDVFDDVYRRCGGCEDYACGRYRVELMVIEQRVNGFRLNWSDVRFLRLNGCGVIR